MPEPVARYDPGFKLLLERVSIVLADSVPLDVTVPVPLGEVVASFGLGPLLIERGKDRHGALRRVNSRWHPVVYRRNGGGRYLSPRERFTVAHEIAHAIIETRIGVRPVRNSQYWALEGKCDWFASRLLIPEVFASPTRSRMHNAFSVISLIKELATATRTSRAAAARRLLDDLSNGSAWGIRQIAGHDHRVAYRVDWAAGVRRHGLSAGSHIRPSCDLFDLVAPEKRERSQKRGQLEEAGVLAHVRMSPTSSLIAWWDAPGTPEAQLRFTF